jgi:hypothetical protein
MIASLFDYLHLGDKITCCIALQSLGVQENSTIEVHGCEAVEDLISGLGLDRLTWRRGFVPLGRDLCLMDLFAFLDGTEIPFFTSPSISVDFQPPKINNIQIPVQNAGLGRVTLFQFDSRSTNENKKKLSRSESMIFLKKKSRFKAMGIGGHDTKKDLPYEYKLGDLPWIIETMRDAGQFVGVDSGMSHIAGALGVPSDIYLMHKKEKDVKIVERFYKEFYPNTNCTHDFSRCGERMPKVKIF